MLINILVVKSINCSVRDMDMLKTVEKYVDMWIKDYFIAVSFVSLLRYNIQMILKKHIIRVFT